jgi:hypothetical protein
VIGLFKRCLATSLRAVTHLRGVFVAIGALAIATMFLWTGFGARLASSGEITTILLLLLEPLCAIAGLSVDGFATGGALSRSAL